MLLVGDIVLLVETLFALVVLFDPVDVVFVDMLFELTLFAVLFVDVVLFAAAFFAGPSSPHPTARATARTPTRG